MAERVRKAIEEYGIHTNEELNEAIQNFEGLDIGLFVVRTERNGYEEQST